LYERSRKPHTCVKKRQWTTEVVDALCTATHTPDTAPWGAATLTAHVDREGIPAPSATTSGRILCHLRKEGRIDDLDDEKYRQKQPRPLHPYAIPYRGSLHYHTECIHIDVDHHVFDNAHGWYHFSAVHTLTGYVGAHVYMQLTSWRGADFVDRIARACPPGITITTILRRWRIGGSSSLCRSLPLLRIRACGYTAGIAHKQNAYGERAHRTFEREYYGTRMFPASTCAVINEGLKEFCHHYTHRRPHGGHGLRTPMEEVHRVAQEREHAYTKSTRAP